MEHDINIPMAVVDFIPVILCGIAIYNFILAFNRKMTTGQRSFFAAGGILLVASGFLKALWKLLYALGVCDIPLLSDQLMLNNTLAFICLASSTWAMIIKNKDLKDTTLYSFAAVPVITSKMMFIIPMTLSVILWYIGMAVAAFKKKNKSIAFMILFTMITALVKSGLGSSFDGSAVMNWVAEGVMTIGEISLCLAAVKFRKLMDEERQAI